LSRADLAKWDTRYREGAYAGRTQPTALLARYAGSFNGPALDIAAGAGRNALFLAARGVDVDAVDISGVGLARLRDDADARGLRVATFEADLEHGIGAELGLRDTYALIVMVRYVNMALLPALFDRLAAGGVLLCEQHLQTDQAVIGPANRAFRVAPNALLAACDGLHVQHYHEGLITDPDGRRAALAQIIASRGTALLYE
jgi:tellurite methyltransferase